MADQPKDTRKSKADSKKKQAGTVLLTPEELRAISGGVKLGPTNPQGPAGDRVKGRP
jgi:hypothetical protein